MKTTGAKTNKPLDQVDGLHKYCCTNTNKNLRPPTCHLYASADGYV
jgi:hypothetical protein